MKKALAFILILAMLVSVISAVSFTSASAAGETLGYAITRTQGDSANAQIYSATGGGFIKAGDLVDGVYSEDYTFYNPNSYSITLTVRYQIAAYVSHASAVKINNDGTYLKSGGNVVGFNNTWTDVAPGTTSTKAITIPAYGKVAFTLDSPQFDENGIYKYQKTVSAVTEVDDYDGDGIKNEVLSGSWTVTWDIPYSKCWLRIDSVKNIRVGDTVYVQCGNPSKLTSVTNKTGFSLDAFDEAGLKDAFAGHADRNSDAELYNTDGWYSIHAQAGAPTISNVADPDNENNRVIKWEPKADEKVYACVSRNLSPYILDGFIDGAGFCYGGGAGTYIAKFRIRAAEGTTGKFDVTLNAKLHRGNPITEGIYKGDYLKVNGELTTLRSNTYTSSVPDYRFTVTDEWQEVFVPVTVSQTYIDTLLAYANSDGKYYNADGTAKTGSGSTFNVKDALQIDFRMSQTATPRITYYIDDFEFYKNDYTQTSGRIFEITKDIPLGVTKDKEGNITGYPVTYPYWRATGLNSKGVITADMADENGIITREWRVYNIGDKEATFKLFYQNDWSTFTDAQVTDNAFEETIAPGDYADFKSTIRLNGDRTKVISDKGEFPLTDLTFRYDFGTIGSNEYKGIRMYVEPIGNDGVDPIHGLTSYKASSSYGATLSSTTGAPFTNSYLIKESPVVSAVGAQVSIGADMSVDYVINAPLDFINGAPQMEFVRNGKITFVEGVRYGDGTYHFNYTGINAQCMGDNIYARLLVNTEKFLEIPFYSVKQNAINLYNSTAAELGLTANSYAKLKTFLADMLAYGAEAQRYTGYNTADIVDADLDWATSDFVSPQPVANKVVKNDVSNQVTSVGLNVSNDIKIYYRLSVQNGAVVKINGEVVEVEDGKVYTDGIRAIDFDDVYTLTVEVGGEVVTEINYSVNTYVYAMQDSAKTGALAKAIGNFGASAVALVEEVRAE